MRDDGIVVTTVNDDITIAEPEGGQRFGTDALLLAAFAKAMTSGKAAELGAGSGIVSLLCAARGKFADIDAVEIQPELAALCERNVTDNRLGERIHVFGADARDYCRMPENAGQYGAVLFNPPYMKEASGFRPDDDGRFAARHEVNGNITELCAAAAKLLRWGGVFYSVYRPDRLCDLICALRAASLEPKRMIFVCGESGSAPCLALTEARLGGKPSLSLAAPLILREDGAPTSEFQYILDNGSFRE